MIISSSLSLHQHALKNVISGHWLESVLQFPSLFWTPHHFSIWMLMSLSHTVSGHSAFLSSLIFPCRFAFASPVVLVTWTNHPNSRLLAAYTGSWDPITSTSSSLMELLVPFTVFDISVILWRHLNSKMWISYSTAVVFTWDYWGHSHPQRSSLNVLEMCLYLSRFWQAVRFGVMGVIPYFKI